MSVIIRGATSNTLADVDQDGNLKVNLPTILSGAGYVSIVSEVDAGNVTGVRLQRQSDASQDYRTRVGMDKILWQDTFNHTVLNTSKYVGVTSTQTVTLAGGFLKMNAGGSVASGAVSRIQTFRTFSIFNTYPLYVDMQLKFSNTLQASSVIEFGLGYATTTTAPTDGVFFRVSGGQVNGVMNNNGTEIQVANIYTPNPNDVNHYLIVIGQDSVEFWVDDILRGEISRATALGSPCQSNSLPILIRNYNSGVVSSAIQLNVAQIAVTLGDMDSGKDWATSMVTNGQSTISAPDGQTAAQTANYANSAAPASATLSNTTAGYATLGGQFQFVAVAGAETDYALFAYLNPAGTSLIPGKTMLVTGVRIDTFNMGAAVATTPTTLQWAIAVGGTAVTLVTTDSATAGTRAARRLPLGTQALVVATPIGGQSDKTIDARFGSPLMVEPGTYLHIILKMPVATATASQIIRGVVQINGYFE